MKPLSIYVSLLAMVTFAVVGSAVAGNIPYDPSCEKVSYEKQESVTQGRVAVTGSANIPYDPSHQHYSYNEQRSITDARVGPSSSANVPYDPSHKRYTYDEQTRSYGIEPKWYSCK